MNVYQITKQFVCLHFNWVFVCMHIHSFFFVSNWGNKPCKLFVIDFAITFYFPLFQKIVITNIFQISPSLSNSSFFPKTIPKSTKSTPKNSPQNMMNKTKPNPPPLLVPQTQTTISHRENALAGQQSSGRVVASCSHGREFEGCLGRWGHCWQTRDPARVASLSPRRLGHKLKRDREFRGVSFLAPSRGRGRVGWWGWSRGLRKWPRESR